MREECIQPTLLAGMIIPNMGKFQFRILSLHLPVLNIENDSPINLPYYFEQILSTITENQIRNYISKMKKFICKILNTVTELKLAKLYNEKAPPFPTVNSKVTLFLQIS